jgi:hypothetical protein
MNIPQFTAAASLYGMGTYPIQYAISPSSSSRAIEPALPIGRPKCSNTCPSGQILVECDKHCACCVGGGRCTLNGDVLCDKNPSPGGFGFPFFSLGSRWMG